MKDEVNGALSATKKKPMHIKLTSHPSSHGEPVPAIDWGNPDAKARGPVIASTTDHDRRNAIGTHAGAYSVYRAMAVAAGALNPEHRPDLTNTLPAVDIPEAEQWGDPSKIVSFDPFGHRVSADFADKIAEGWDIRPTIAITKAHINIPEITQAMKEGNIKADGEVLKETGEIVVTKMAMEPVWYLPAVAERFNCTEAELRRSLFEHTAGMFPELVTRPDLKVFLPPIGGTTVYVMGDLNTIQDPTKELSCRVHDECNGSDVFGSDICTCRPYLTHGIEMCIESAQKGGAGVIVYNRKEGRALGEVTKFLVYNARKRQVGGDSAQTYFHRTECVAGVQDMRFQELMPDALCWLGIKHIDRFVSMSDMKFNALSSAGITVGERVTIPDELIPADAQVEMEAKKAAGYYAPEGVLEEDDLEQVKGRGLND